MDLTNKEYGKLVKKSSKNTNITKTFLGAFFIGGLICGGSEILRQLYVMAGINEKEAFALVSITLIFLSATITGLKLYDSIAKIAGAGTLVPITGFANSIVAPALEFKNEGYILGIGGKMFTIAGPVLVYGITSSILYGVIIFIFGLV